MNRSVLVLMILLAASWGGSCALQAVPPPDLVLFNGKVFTSDPAGLWAEAVAVQGNRILAVGADAELLGLARRGTRLFDLGGRTVIPGLNDAHVHALVPQGVQVNAPTFVPGPGPTVQEVSDLLAAAAAVQPPDTWLFATVGTAFSEDPAAERSTLDQAAPQHPVLLTLWTGHGMYLNSRGLAELGIADNEPDPFGGFYERQAGGQLNGVVHEYAEHQVRRRFAQRLSDAEIAAIYRAFAEQAVRRGITSVQEMSVGLQHARGVAILGGIDLPLRWRAICFPLTPEEPCHRGPAPSPLVAPTGVKWISDGTPVERLAFLAEPYADRPETRGRFNLPAEAFPGLVAGALHGPRQKSQLLVHAVGDAAIAALLGQMEALAPATRWRDRRARIEHGDLVNPADIQRVRDLGLVIVQNPTHLGLPDLPQRLEPTRLAAAQPLRSLLDAGIPLALGSDGIGSTLNPFLDLFLASLHPGRPAEALSREQAVIAYTAGSAYAEFEEHSKGRLGPGQLADLAVLSEDVFTAGPPALFAIRSLLTIVDGRIVWNEGVLQEVSGEGRR